MSLKINGRLVAKPELAVVLGWDGEQGWAARPRRLGRGRQGSEWEEGSEPTRRSWVSQPWVLR